MEATFKINLGYYTLLQLKWLLYVLIILGPEVWKPHLKESHVSLSSKVVIVTILTEHTTQKWKPQIDGLFQNLLHI